MNSIYIKVFVISLVGFLALFGGIFVAIDNTYGTEEVRETTEPVDVETSVAESEIPTTEPVEIDDRSELEKAAEVSSRINVIAFGLNDHLADTMMLVSLDPEIPRLDIISIPRDTYNHIEGHDGLGQKKMNAIYGMKDIGGVNGMKKYVSEFMGIPVDYYVRIDFKAVEAIVDTLGGYEVRVPYDMVYDDIYADPPLHIDIKAGKQVLSGSETVKFLRFRQNNDGTIKEGDIQRIPRQQQFVDYMIQKSLSFKLPSVINTIIGSRYVRTDLTLEDALAYALKAATLEKENIQFYTLEGEDTMMGGVSYWIHDPAKLEEKLFELYGLN
ncbi:LCP family protein [Fusibacter tunisiensis]|uniref:LCP family protein required for cell wall assembly n=1 Tax=Fusibacter tunisiensis TaxID=1008308 RepID=A0ABS2MR59_9FIRM|nr:LCP family protein [Fusibacter tunisiensis]MBM7561892.1 LCP family protein required for cell wall assembly [Fusibacter tunisiensis]